jgi:SAM-dependent methyltransferase
MTEIDVAFFNLCLSSGFVNTRLLEVGSAKVQGFENICDIARSAGISETTGVDIQTFDGVDAVVDFGLPPEVFEKHWKFGKFGTVCVFNVLEHTFDPITVLANALSCLEKDGHLLVVTPSIWDLHNYPGDFVRLLPNWYEQFAERYDLNLLKDSFCWLSCFGIQKIYAEKEPAFPTFLRKGREASWIRYWTSRFVHKAFNTYGRSHWFNHVAIGAVFRAKN